MIMMDGISVCAYIKTPGTKYANEAERAMMPKKTKEQKHAEVQAKYIDAEGTDNMTILCAALNIVAMDPGVRDMLFCRGLNNG